MYSAVVIPAAVPLMMSSSTFLGVCGFDLRYVFAAPNDMNSVTRQNGYFGDVQAAFDISRQYWNKLCTSIEGDNMRIFLVGQGLPKHNRRNTQRIRGGMLFIMAISLMNSFHSATHSGRSFFTECLKRETVKKEVLKNLQLQLLPIWLCRHLHKLLHLLSLQS